MIKYRKELEELLNEYDNYSFEELSDVAEHHRLETNDYKDIYFTISNFAKFVAKLDNTFIFEGLYFNAFGVDLKERKEN